MDALRIHGKWTALPKSNTALGDEPIAVCLENNCSKQLLTRRLVPGFDSKFSALPPCPTDRAAESALAAAATTLYVCSIHGLNPVQTGGPHQACESGCFVSGRFGVDPRFQLPEAFGCSSQSLDQLRVLRQTIYRGLGCAETPGSGSAA